MFNSVKQIITTFFTRQKIQKYRVFLYVFFLVPIGLCIWLTYYVANEVQKDTYALQTSGYVVVSDSSSIVTTQRQIVTDEDEAVRTYLKAAQLQIEIYAFTNNGLYGGMCEPSKTLYTLEGGILKYIKMVGATEVFCSNSDTLYLIEAKLPLSGLFYCIDNTGASVEQKETREGKPNCRN